MVARKQNAGLFDVIVEQMRLLLLVGIWIAGALVVVVEVPWCLCVHYVGNYDVGCCWANQPQVQVVVLKEDLDFLDTD